jgi:glycerophosphoryl diester phosphodiesterase
MGLVDPQTRGSGARHPFLRTGHPIAMAHRGGGEPALENTWSAFRDAVSLGYGYLETDAWSTADGQVVLFHDQDLGRVSDRTGRISDLSYAEVARARIAGTQQIPLLSDVLAEWPQIRLNIDLKCDQVVEPFVQVIEKFQAWDRVCVASFSDRRILRAARLAAGRACLSAGRSTVARLRIASAVPGIGRPPLRFRPDVVQVPVRSGRIPIVTPTFVTRLHRWGIDVHCWTVNDRPTMLQLLELGVDGLVSDATADLKGVLQERGQWNEPPGRQ